MSLAAELKQYIARFGRDPEVVIPNAMLASGASLVMIGDYHRAHELSLRLCARLLRGTGGFKYFATEYVWHHGPDRAEVDSFLAAGPKSKLPVPASVEEMGPLLRLLRLRGIPLLGFGSDAGGGENASAQSMTNARDPVLAANLLEELRDHRLQRSDGLALAGFFHASAKKYILGQKNPMRQHLPSSLPVMSVAVLTKIDGSDRVRPVKKPKAAAVALVDLMDRKLDMVAVRTGLKKPDSPFRLVAPPLSNSGFSLAECFEVVVLMRQSAS